MPTRAKDLRIDAVSGAAISLIWRERAHSRRWRWSGYNSMGRDPGRRRRNVNVACAVTGMIHGWGTVARSDFRPRGCAGMAFRAGGKFSRTIAFRNANRAAGRDGPGIQHQQLAKLFLARVAAGADRLNGRSCRMLGCGQTEVAEISFHR